MSLLDKWQSLITQMFVSTYPSRYARTVLSLMRLINLMYGGILYNSKYHNGISCTNKWVHTYKSYVSSSIKNNVNQIF